MSSQGPAAQIGGSGGAASAADLAGLIEGFSQRVDLVRRQLGQVIFGQEQTVEQALIAILSGGHVLLIGVPGLAKTKLVDSLGQVLGVDAQRVQCTPDLMPCRHRRLRGARRERVRTAQLPLHQGPGVLPVADGGRNQPRQPAHPVRAAAGDAGTQGFGRRPAPIRCPSRSTCSRPRTRWSRKAPIPLPEAQLDRFLLQIDVDYPSNDAERQMLIVTTGSHEAGLTRVLSRGGRAVGRSAWCGACQSAKRWSTRS